MDFEVRHFTHVSTCRSLTIALRNLPKLSSTFYCILRGLLYLWKSWCNDRLKTLNALYIFLDNFNLFTPNFEFFSKPSWVKRIIKELTWQRSNVTLEILLGWKLLQDFIKGLRCCILISTISFCNLSSFSD